MSLATITLEEYGFFVEPKSALGFVCLMSVSILLLSEATGARWFSLFRTICRSVYGRC